MKIKVEHGHSARVEGPHGLVCVGDVEWRNRYGSRRGRRSTLWLVFICNDTDCRARTLVRSDSIGAAIEEDAAERELVA